MTNEKQISETVMTKIKHRVCSVSFAFGNCLMAYDMFSCSFSGRFGVSLASFAVAELFIMAFIEKERN